MGRTAQLSREIETDVIIIGGGPVGLLAAADLDARGVRTVVVERRAFLEAPDVKCNHVSARTMERLRMLGMAAKVREAGLPADYPHDVSFCTTLTGRELARIRIPARAERYTSRNGPDTSWATPEPPHRINQRFLEPVLMEHVAALPHVALLTEAEYFGLSQRDDAVTAEVEYEGETITLVGRYLIGADGGKSRVRKEIGAKLQGDAVLSRVQSSWIHADSLYERSPNEPAWGYYSFNPRRNGHVYAIDGVSQFLVHNYLDDGEGAGEQVDRDRSIREILGVGEDFAYELISVQDWVARRLVVDRMRDRRVFLAGDASHLWVPYAGYGMNAGIADVLNLTWLLGAVLAGWADDRVLDAYEEERLPITQQVSHFAMGHQRKIASGDIPAEIEDDTPEAEAARARLAAEVYALNVQQFAAEGLNFGYSYDASPIIAYDGETAPGYSMGGYTPSTVPGCRAPHFVLPDGTSLYDRLGLYYTVIVQGAAEDAAPLVEAARRASAPLDVVAVPPGAAPEEYTRRFTLVRQDQHVIWRGDELPDDIGSLLSRIGVAAADRSAAADAAA